jgi:sugar lactone lactonase YvrE
MSRIALDAEGLIYAAAEDEGTILVFAPDGRRLGAFTSSAPGGLKRPQGLVVDPELDRLYAVDLGNSRVQAFDLDRVRAALGIRDAPRFRAPSYI